MSSPFSQVFKHLTSVLVDAEVPEDIALRSLEITKRPDFGDIASTVSFDLAKVWKKSPTDIAQEVVSRIEKKGLIKDVKAVGPYINFFLDWNEFSRIVFSSLNTQYGSADVKKTIVIDFSAPNIAKPFSIAHLRSTIIGDSIARIYEFLGWKVHRVNYLGDWGTQFGKLLTAFELWGNENELDERGIRYLLELYVRFHKEAEKDKSLEDKARNWFKRLEQGDKTAVELWERFKDISLREFLRIYNLLGVNFTQIESESESAKHCRPVVDELLAKDVAKREPDGSVIVPLDNLPNYLILKSDGATLYSTRDLWTAKNRFEKYGFDKMVYVVGAEQKLHFQQLFSTLKKAGYSWADSCIHIPFGLIHLPGGEKLSTRKGRVIFLEDILNESINKVKEIIKNRINVSEDLSKISQMVGIGAVKFADLSTDRVKDVVFDWARMLSFEGDSGPYLQYAHARACRIIEKAGETGEIRNITKREEYNLIKEIARFPDVVLSSASDFKPNYIADYLLKLASLFNNFYAKCPVLSASSDIKSTRLAIVNAVRICLRNGLNLLGIEAPDRM